MSFHNILQRSLWIGAYLLHQAIPHTEYREELAIRNLLLPHFKYAFT